MPVLRVGAAAIAYTVRRRRSARRVRITIRPGRVEVVAPWFTRTSRIRTFVESKGHWILDKTKSMAQRDILAAPERFVVGERLRFRGRSLGLRVDEGSGRSLSFKNGFRVTVEPGLEADERERVVRALVMSWLRERARADAEAWARVHGAALGVRPTRIRIGNQKTLWGSCSARGVISLNWRLVTAPKPVFEYVVVHELCHLRERNHGPRFWRLVGGLVPDYRERRQWLKKRGVGLG